MSADYDAPEFECQACGKRAVSDGTDALLGWFHDEDGELAFCAECGPENLIGPPSQEILDRFHDMKARHNATVTDYLRTTAERLGLEPIRAVRDARL